MKRNSLIILLVAGLAAVATFVLAGDALNPQTNAAVVSADAAYVAAYANPDALVDTAWVLENLNNPDVRFVDVSNQRLSYETGHLPGAVYISPRTELTNPEDVTEGQIAPPEQFAEILGSRGISNEHLVVLYDDNSNLFASRAYWTFAYYSHENVRIYNGGTKRWAADGQRLSIGNVNIEPTTYVTGEINEAVRVDYDYVIASLERGDVLLCDSRSVGEYVGDDVRAAEGGHIPGAVNIEWVQAVNEDGTFKSVGELAALFYGAGFTPDKEIISYCQTGVRSAHTWFVLTELLGYPNVRNYDGSWTEYGNTEDAPIVKPESDV